MRKCFPPFFFFVAFDRLASTLCGPLLDLNREILLFPKQEDNFEAESYEIYINSRHTYLYINFLALRSLFIKLAINFGKFALYSDFLCSSGTTNNVYVGKWKAGGLYCTPKVRCLFSCFLLSFVLSIFLWERLQCWKKQFNFSIRIENKKIQLLHQSLQFLVVQHEKRYILLFFALVATGTKSSITNLVKFFKGIFSAQPTFPFTFFEISYLGLPFI